MALLVGCVWLYWQNLNLQQQNASLKKNLAAATRKLSHLHQKTPSVAEASAETPVEEAQRHLELAQDAFLRRDYATALRQLDLADDAAHRAAKDASQETRRSAQQIMALLDDLRRQVKSVAGPWIKPSGSASVS